ncbi:MAG: HAMP domain-containing sensor histidine kinase [Bacteroidota bacterium]|nr:HAMP domain-containing sensor histidine kinase [Bacteroidota bacterium]
MSYSGNKSENEMENCRKQLSQLQSENDELLRNLHKVNEKLRDSERFKGHFISNITNEIVNPFASVLALAGNIQQLNEGQMGTAHRMAELIFDEAFHLDFQLKNIFAAAGNEAGMDEIKLSSFSIKDLSDHLNQYFSKQLKKKRIRLLISFINESEPDESLMFLSDREKLDLILKNLISNSIKFSHDDSTIEIVFIFSNRILSVEVSDHGKGIVPDNQKIIFDRFKQLDEKINSINTGHGLGLSIVLAYANLLGGTVNINDNFDGGIRITVSIPESAETNDWDDLEGFILDSETSY